MPESFSPLPVIEIVIGAAIAYFTDVLTTPAKLQPASRFDEFRPRGLTAEHSTNNIGT